MKSADRRGREILPVAPAGGMLGVQALVEYGVLNSLARDATMALQRFGGWAAENWFIVAAVLGVVILGALRPKR